MAREKALVRLVHLEGDWWIEADHVQWGEDDEDWGIATIHGIEYEVNYSYDGDRYIQMPDREIDRYYCLNG